MLPENVKKVPKKVYRVLACTCQADEPCKKGNCSSRSFQISCTMFCKCYTGDKKCAVKCVSPWNVPEENYFETYI